MRASGLSSDSAFIVLLNAYILRSNKVKGKEAMRELFFFLFPSFRALILGFEKSAVYLLMGSMSFLQSVEILFSGVSIHNSL